MKVRYSKLLATELFIRETKAHFLAPWKVTKYCGVIPIAYRRVNGKFVREDESTPDRELFSPKNTKK